jgi:hypothetical protein
MVADREDAESGPHGKIPSFEEQQANAKAFIAMPPQTDEWPSAVNIGADFPDAHLDQPGMKLNPNLCLVFSCLLQWRDAFRTLDWKLVSRELDGIRTDTKNEFLKPTLKSE